jgi:hypothetical protein
LFFCREGKKNGIVFTAVRDWILPNRISRMRRGCADSSRSDRFVDPRALDFRGGDGGSGDSIPDDNSGDGIPDDNSGVGAPDDNSGVGAPDKTSGDGASDNTSGDGTPDNTSGDDTPDNTSGDDTPDNTSGDDTARRFAYGSEHQIHVGAYAIRDHDDSKSR